MRFAWFFILTLLCCSLQAQTAAAQKIPPHLSKMTSGLVSQLKGHIKHSENSVLQDAGRILKGERIHQWSKTPAKIKGGAKKLAESVGLDISKAQDWLAVKQLLQETDISARHEQMKAILKDRGLKVDENTIMENLANFDIAKEALLKGMDTQHRYKISKHEKAAISWDPETGQYEMRVTGARDKAGKEQQQTILYGDVELWPSKSGGDLEMVMKPSEKPIKTLSTEEIKAREDSIFGEWTDGKKTWFIKLDEDSKSFQKGSDLPIDKSNPLRINDMASYGARPLKVTVVRSDGSEYVFRNAYLSGLHIKADRTLSDKRDIKELPRSIIDQLISSWSPPEWVGLEIVYGRSAKDTRIEGNIWRLHVSYESGIAGPGPVTKIANPYKEDIFTLTRDVSGRYKTAEGAEKGSAF